MKQQAQLKDYLMVYVRNHNVPLLSYVPVVVCFLAAKFAMYGQRADPITILMYELILVAPFAVLFFQRRLYRTIQGWAEYPMGDEEARWLILRIALYKMLYMLPWLFLMFFPLQGIYVYDHLLGYLFVFFATSLYASASAVLMPLFIFDIGLQVAFAVYITWLNHGIQETPYIGGAIALFCLFALYSGIKFHQSQVELIDSRATSNANAKKAQDANAAKSRFLALMSHEIRTPMTGIVGMVEFMKETPLNTEQQNFLNTISECSKTLLNTLNDILDISKLEAGKLEISNINCDFHAILTNCVRLLTRVASDKNIYLKLEIGADVPKLIYGDPHRMQQVIINLLNNAVKFTTTGGVTLKAAFRPGAIPVLRVEVTDTGIGISKENIKKLFKSFSQADSSIARKFGGTGLGLSIIKSLMGLMGGKLGVKSTEGEGSTFWFELPYHEPHADEAAAEQEGIPLLSPLNILVAEDNKVNQQIALRLLGNKGHKVTIANDGIEAVRLARDMPRFDIILMDVNMPMKSGLDATLDIRNTDNPNRTVPIIALTASIVDEHVKSCLAAGMDGYVAKPFSPRQLYREMAKMLPDKVMTLQEQQVAEKNAPRPETHAAAAAVAPAPSPAPARKSGLNENLRAIREELGAAYMTQLVDNSIKEVRHQLQLMQEEYARQDYTALHRSAHDLKGVSGLIGMGETCHHAEAVEKACSQNRHADLPALLAVLQKDGEREIHEMEEIRGGETPA